MKKLLIIVYLLALARVGSAEMTSRQLIEKAITALGGKDKLQAVQSYTASGKVQVAGLTGTYEVNAKSPDRYRLSLDLGVIQQVRGFDGTHGWVQQTSIAEQQGADLARIKRAALFLPLFAYAKAGTPSSFKGAETLDNGKKAFVLEFTPQTGAPEQFYLDQDTFLLTRETRQVPNREGGMDAVTIDYADYRSVDGIMVPFSITQTQPNQVLSVQFDQYKMNPALAEDIFHNPSEKFAGEPYDIQLSTIPHHVYKENDGVFEPTATDSFYFRLVVSEKHSRPVEPVSAVVQFYSGKDLVETAQFSEDALSAIRAATLGGFASQPEVFDLNHYFTQPVKNGVDRMVYSLELKLPDGSKSTKQLEVPIEQYQQKTKLIFPIKGNFVVAGGHDFNEAHSGEWSQHYAYDIEGLGPNFEFLKEGGTKNSDFYTWGREVLAPADGIVAFARNDIPENQTPGDIDNKVFISMPNPMFAVAGNNVIIDHGNGEFSLLAHMQKGSVRVKEGDHVKQGQVMGLLGNTGNSDAPHLHYHLMACATIFRCDGLPSHFENVYDIFSGDKLKAEFVKRGLFLQAK